MSLVNDIYVGYVNILYSVGKIYNTLWLIALCVRVYILSLFVLKNTWESKYITMLFCLKDY